MKRLKFTILATATSASAFLSSANWPCSDIASTSPTEASAAARARCRARSARHLRTRRSSLPFLAPAAFRWHGSSDVLL
eukprot:5524619-Pleurochrysis_carterae.AAC.1